MTGGKGKDVFVLSSDKDIITDFELGKDDIGLVYSLDLKFKQKGDDLLIKGNDGVNTLLLGIDKKDFLKDLENDAPELLPAVEVNVL